MYLTIIYSSLQKDLKSKTTLLCQMLDYQRAIESELETLRGKVANLSLLQERAEGLIGVPAWVTKYKQVSISYYRDNKQSV